MTNVLSDRPDESIYTEDKIRGRYTFLGQKKCINRLQKTTIVLIKYHII